VCLYCYIFEKREHLRALSSPNTILFISTVNSNIFSMLNDTFKSRFIAIKATHKRKSLSVKPKILQKKHKLYYSKGENEINGEKLS
jgi:hypothetical protein